jgi:hypothetical protein
VEELCAADDSETKVWKHVAEAVCLHVAVRVLKALETTRPVAVRIVRVDGVEVVTVWASP